MTLKSMVQVMGITKDIGEKLAPANGGSDSHLSEEKTVELVTYLTNNLLPITQAIIEQVIDWWGISYTVPGMTKWLHRNGFSGHVFNMLMLT